MIDLSSSSNGDVFPLASFRVSRLCTQHYGFTTTHIGFFHRQQAKETEFVALETVDRRRSTPGGQKQHAQHNDGLPVLRLLSCRKE